MSRLERELGEALLLLLLQLAGEGVLGMLRGSERRQPGGHGRRRKERHCIFEWQLPRRQKKRR